DWTMVQSHPESEEVVSPIDIPQSQSGSCQEQVDNRIDGDKEQARKDNRTDQDKGLIKKLNWLDRFLPFWIIAFMALGILFGYVVPSINNAFQVVQIHTVSLPIGKFIES